MIEERGDVHHVFPKKYLQKNGYNNRRHYNQIANYVYTEQSVNLAIKDKPPEKYMNIVKQQIKNNEINIGEIDNKVILKENMKMNSIPESIFEMNAKDYDEFLVQRRKLMANKIEMFYKSL